MSAAERDETDSAAGQEADNLSSAPADAGEETPQSSSRRRPRRRRRIRRRLVRQLRRFVFDDQCSDDNRRRAEEAEQRAAAALASSSSSKNDKAEDSKDGDPEEIRRRTAPTGLVGRCRDLHHQAVLLQRRLESNKAASVAIVAYQRRGRQARRFGNVALLGLQASSSSSSSSTSSTSSVEELALDHRSSAASGRPAGVSVQQEPPPPLMAPRSRFYDVLEGCRRSQAFGARFDLDRCRSRFQLVARRRIEPPLGAGLRRLDAWERPELVRCALGLQSQFGLRRCSLQIPRGIGAALALTDRRDLPQGLAPSALVLVPEVARYLEAFRYACTNQLVPGWPLAGQQWVGQHWLHPCRDPKFDRELYEKNVILAVREDVRQQRLDPVLAVTLHPPTEQQMKQMQQEALKRPTALVKQQEDQQKHQRRLRQLQRLADSCPTYKGFILVRHPTQRNLLGFCHRAAHIAELEAQRRRPSPEELLDLLEAMDGFVDDVLLGNDGDGGGSGGGCKLNVSLDCAYQFPGTAGGVYGCLQLPPAAAAAFDRRRVGDNGEQRRQARPSVTTERPVAPSGAASSRPMSGLIFVDPDYEKPADSLSRCSIQ